MLLFTRDRYGAFKKRICAVKIAYGLKERKKAPKKERKGLWESGKPQTARLPTFPLAPLLVVIYLKASFRIRTNFVQAG
ncbi:MAG TPA: hypothetical protein VGJ48_27225 [Pyrinomonadaceae bacterium]|jgi:hypothetical protein